MLDSTTVKVSKRTARQLSALQHSLRARSIEETINMLVRKHRKELLDDALGADRGNGRTLQGGGPR